MEDVTSKLEETEINMNTEEKNPQGTPEEREKHRQDIKDQVTPNKTGGVPSHMPPSHHRHHHSSIPGICLRGDGCRS